MDERYRSKGPLIAGIVVAGIILMCLMLCFMGALGNMFLRSSAQVVAPVAPPAIGEDAAQPQVYHGPWIGVRTGAGVLGWFALGAVFFFGLLLLLGIGRFVLGPRRCAPLHGGLHPADKRWKGQPHPWGPRSWHGHGGEWQEGEDSARGGTPADDEDLAQDGAG
jgi:hypothetical protein